MALSPYVEPSVLALAPAVYWPLQDLTGPVFDAGLVPHSPSIGTGTTLGVDTGLPLGTSFSFDGSTTCGLTAGFSAGPTQPQSMGMFFSISDLTKADQMLAYVGSNNSGDGWGVAFNHTGNGHIWVLRGGIAWTDLGVSIADHAWHSFYAGYTPTNMLGVTVDGVYGFVGVLAFNAPSQHLSVGTDLYTGGNDHLNGGAAHFAFWFQNIPSSADWNAVIQAGQGIASSSVGASQKDVADMTAELDLIYAAVHRVFPST